MQAQAAPQQIFQPALGGKIGQPEASRNNFGPIKQKSNDSSVPDIMPKFLQRDCIPGAASTSQQSQNSRKSFRQPKQVPVSQHSYVYDPAELDERINSSNHFYKNG